jgi:branched-chain amino acid transport system substrate-binding protein
MLSQKIRSSISALVLALTSIVVIGIGGAQELLAQERFKVGAILPLTGAAADYGIAIKNCIELAKKDKPELFTNIDFIFEDAAYDPKTAVSAYRSLTDGQRVDLTLTWGVSFCKAAGVRFPWAAPLFLITIQPSHLPIAEASGPYGRAMTAPTV